MKKTNRHRAVSHVGKKCLVLLSLFQFWAAAPEDVSQKTTTKLIKTKKKDLQRLRLLL